MLANRQDIAVRQVGTFQLEIQFRVELLSDAALERRGAFGSRGFVFQQRGGVAVLAPTSLSFNHRARLDSRVQLLLRDHSSVSGVRLPGAAPPVAPSDAERAGRPTCASSTPEYDDVGRQNQIQLPSGPRPTPQ